MGFLVTFYSYSDSFPGVILDTIRISKPDSIGIWPNWFTLELSDRPALQNLNSAISVTNYLLLTGLCDVTAPSGNSYYFSFYYQTWSLGADFPVRLVIEQATTSISNHNQLPNSFRLLKNYPNPFNPITTIQYELPERSDVQIIIYDLLGRKIASLLSETQEAGIQSVQWNATNVPSGMYFYQIRVYDPDEVGTGEFVQTRKMVLLK